ncbi:hypothetical protein [Bacteroides hominis]|uniref:hypothetical protein n=1 Tax=Bacteroides hominis TaxID=2763023 RepID=UPI002273E5FE|nr:hypothetical protein [Bacteroides fragilis]MCX8463569.1 hypothetical protein [Bacteroides fragilis]MCY2673142.1 hypothetical protein [Bacteroides fragilis]MCY6343105.1 hypothetical protein [Bacteroides fragilis]MDA1493752.1 hypothetical protein [Bacteroides fragilis]
MADKPFGDSDQTGGSEVQKLSFSSSRSRLGRRESRCFHPKEPVFPEKEVSIWSERRKQLEKMLTSFWNISICFSHYIYCSRLRDEKREIFFWLTFDYEGAETDKREVPDLNNTLFVLILIE